MGITVAVYVIDGQEHRGGFATARALVAVVVQRSLSHAPMTFDSGLSSAFFSAFVAFPDYSAV